MQRYWHSVVVWSLVCFGLASVVSRVATGAANQDAPNRPNIFFFFADDWGRYASIYKSFGPNAALRTPVMDRFAREGVRFNNAHVTAPSCTPCRSSLLSGQYFYRTGRGAILQGARWDPEIPSYPLLLEKAGYHIGYTYKVWSPGSPVDAPYGGKAREYAPAGKRFCGFSQNATKMVQSGKTAEQAKTELCAEGMKNFEAFLATVKPESPSGTGLAPPIPIASGSRDRARPSGAWNLTTSRDACLNFCRTCTLCARTCATIWGRSWLWTGCWGCF